MTIRFMFNGTERAFEIQPGNDLERALLKDMASQCEKGATINLKLISHPTQDPTEENTGFRVELVVKK